MKQKSLFLGLLFLALSAFAVNITAIEDTIKQNFNSIGVAAVATLPADWKMDKKSTVRTVGPYPTLSGAGNKTELRDGVNMSATAANGIYNFGFGPAATATDRAIGFLSSASATKSGNIYLKLTNTGTKSIYKLKFSYDLFKFRNGKNSDNFCFQLYTSANGSAWTSAGDNFKSKFWPDEDNLGFAELPAMQNSVMESYLTLPTPLIQNGSVYLAWNYSVMTGTTTSDAQAWGLDNVQISFVGEPLSGNYTVGTGQDFATISAAVSALNERGVSGSVKLLLTDAVYQLSEYESISLSGITSTGITKNITIKPAPGVNAVITGSSFGILSIDNTRHVIIDGSNTDGGSTKNLTISNTSNNGNAINVGFNSDSCVIKNCNITGSPSIGINISNNTGSVVNSNKVLLTGAYTNEYQSITGILFDNWNSGNIDIYNNMVTITPEMAPEVNSGQIIGVSYYGSADCSFNLFNNSIYIGGSQGYSADSYAFLKRDAATDFKVKNNLFYNVRTNTSTDLTGRHYAVGFENMVAANLFQTNNLLYVTPNATPANTSLGKWGIDESAVVKVDLSAWQETLAGLDVNSNSSIITFEPSLANGEIKFKREVANTAVFNTGFALPGIISTDFYGTARPQYGQTDIGAYELMQSSDLAETALPAATALFQNYPNPFNPETTINFTLANEGKVSLKVYNVKGELVSQLVNSVKPAGSHSIKFNGLGLNSGIYFYELAASDKIITHKMVLAK